MRNYLLTRKNRDLLQYPVEPDDAAIICTNDRNRGRICRVLYKWDGNSDLLSYEYDELEGKDCFVVTTVGSPFTFEKEFMQYKTPSIIVESKFLKRVAHHASIKWNEWH